MKKGFLQGGDWADKIHGKGPQGLSPVEFGEWYRDEMVRRWQELDLKTIGVLAGWLKSARGTKKQIFILGNGGSAASASHMATDLSKTAAAKGKPLLRCLSLTDNTSFITAIGNDLGYDQVFVRQLENLLNRGDIVLMITGSGNSPNLLEAARFAKKKGAKTAALLGFDGGKLKKKVDLPILVPSTQYGCVEDLHMSVGHILAFYLKQD